MAKYKPENYSLALALKNIGVSFWRFYRDDLKIFAEDRNRLDIIEKIHREWNCPNNCTAAGTQIRIEWAMAIYDHGDWDRSTEAPVVQNSKIPGKETIDARLKYPAEYRCENGIYVRSISELCIANWLYANNIRFVYERAVFFEKSQKQAHSDFFLPEYDVHIEYWGMGNDPSYESYKLWKEANYVENNIRYISFCPSDLKNFRDRFDQAIRNLKKQL